MPSQQLGVAKGPQAGRATSGGQTGPIPLSCHSLWAVSPHLSGACLGLSLGLTKEIKKEGRKVGERQFLQRSSSRLGSGLLPKSAKKAPLKAFLTCHLPGAFRGGNRGKRNSTTYKQTDPSGKHTRTQAHVCGPGIHTCTRKQLFRTHSCPCAHTISYLQPHFVFSSHPLLGGELNSRNTHSHLSHLIARPQYTHTG